MTENKCRITILPDEIELEGIKGDSIYTLLVVGGILPPGDIGRLRLDKGTISPAVNPEAEAEIFTSAQRTEGWLLASERNLTGDAVLSRPEWDREEQIPSQPLAEGLGLVFDIGSATIAAGLVILEDCRIPLLTAHSNSQMKVASEIPQRRRWAEARENGEQQLRAMLLEDIQYLSRKLIARFDDQGQQVHAVCCSGNQMMLELLAGEHTLAEKQVTKIAAAELGLEGLAEGAQVYLLPAAANDIGSDVVASCLAADLWGKKDRQQLTLLLDLGMNGRVVAAGRGRLLAASITSLPFEGNGIGCGMPATSGAIIRVDIGKHIMLKTVRDARPQGMAGAGLLSAMRAMQERGLLDQSGRLIAPDNISPELERHLRSASGGRELVLSFADRNFDRDISIDQNDILQLQMAKGAIRAACSALINAMGAEESDVESVLLAESYQAHLDPQDMLALHMIPSVRPEQVSSIGNAAWQGAFLALCSQANLEKCQQIAANLERLDLTADLVYAKEFLIGMEFN